MSFYLKTLVKKKVKMIVKFTASCGTSIWRWHLGNPYCLKWHILHCFQQDSDPRSFLKLAHCLNSIGLIFVFYMLASVAWNSNHFLLRRTCWQFSWYSEFQLHLLRHFEVKCHILLFCGLAMKFWYIRNCHFKVPSWSLCKFDDWYHWFNPILLQKFFVAFALGLPQ